MRTVAIVASLTAVVLVAASGTVFAAHGGQEAHPDEMGEKIDLVKGQAGTRLIGHPVKSRDGQVLGKLADLGFTSGDDPNVYAVISLGGVLGVGPRRVAVPFSEIDVSHRDFLVFTGDPDSLKDRPLFRHTGGER